MAEIFLTKTGPATLGAVDEEAIEALRKIKLGAIVRCEVKQMRNYKFFKRWWALAKIAFDLWVETATMPEHKGVAVQPTFERFRHDLTIMAGYYKVVVNIKLETRLEADSLKFSSMTEEEFEKLYQSTITTILNKVLVGRGLDEAAIREMADRVLEFV